MDWRRGAYLTFPCRTDRPWPPLEGGAAGRISTSKYHMPGASIPWLVRAEQYPLGLLLVIVDEPTSMRSWPAECVGRMHRTTGPLGFGRSTKEGPPTVDKGLARAGLPARKAVAGRMRAHLTI